MTKTVRLLLVLIGLLLFAVGLLLGEQIRRSKFDKYLRQTTGTPMETALLRANIGVISHFLPTKVPTVYYDRSCDCFVGNSTVTSALMKLPMDEVRKELMVLAIGARMALEVEFPEVSKPDVRPDRDFKMEFHLIEDTGAGRTLAEYVDGKIVFK